ncbi:MAG: excinuclease ABC subunit UvrC [Thermodesulfobacteriota bacterium]
MNQIEEKIQHLPTNPGVYIFKDKKGAILYVGKAENLRHRVASYFQNQDRKDAKTLAMLEKVADIETLLTNTGKEALILEDHLVKAHRPRYNIKLRDDKRYPCLRLSIEEEFPTLQIVRQIKKDGALYFGPYPSATSLKETLRLIRKLFPLRTCHQLKFSTRSRPCINYEMGRCLAPCCGKIDSEEYKKMIQGVRMFLEGKDKDLIDRLKKEMEEEAENLRFEKAAKIRDQIEAIRHVIEKQKVVSTDFVDQDVIGTHSQDHTLIIYSLFIRGGKLLGGKGFRFPLSGLPEEEILGSFMYQYYREKRFIPQQILIPKSIPEQDWMEQWLTERSGRRVRIITPEKGEKKKLLDMASENAKKFIGEEIDLEEDRERLLLTLKERLFLNRLPRRIEAFDISNLQGGEAVGSMVTFENGDPLKEGYRHFRIKTIEGIDDYGMLYEILLRRYQKALKEKSLPDLILLDGGKGQLHVAQEVLRELQIDNIDLLALAKGRGNRRISKIRLEKKGEGIYHPQFKEPIFLGKNNPLLHFLDRIRDEAHRFALTYHKKLRIKESIKSDLSNVEGIGRERQRALLKYFGSLEEIKKASLEDLEKVPKMNSIVAKRVYEFFHP